MLCCNGYQKHVLVDDAELSYWPITSQYRLSGNKTSNLESKNKIYASHFKPRADGAWARVIKAKWEGKTSKQGFKVTGDRTRDLSHGRPHANQLCHLWSYIHNDVTTCSVMRGTGWTKTIELRTKFTLLRKPLSQITWFPNMRCIDVK